MSHVFGKNTATDYLQRQRSDRCEEAGQETCTQRKSNFTKVLATILESKSFSLVATLRAKACGNASPHAWGSALDCSETIIDEFLGTEGTLTLECYRAKSACHPEPMAENSETEIANLHILMFGIAQPHSISARQRVSCSKLDEPSASSKCLVLRSVSEIDPLLPVALGKSGHSRTSPCGRQRPFNRLPDLLALNCAPYYNSVSGSLLLRNAGLTEVGKEVSLSLLQEVWTVRQT